ncbi:hypothetical protein EAE96_007026 [Botrytis aclada]|nr:hypothetical protein EAE96_007026 [Botrytis aclada]
MSNLSFPKSYGERLLPQVLENDAKSCPARVYATIAQSSSFETTYRDVTTKEMATAVDYVAWWLKTHTKDIQTYQCIAYIGSSDLRYPLICLAAMKCSLKVLLPGPRNSIVQNQSLLSRAKCFMVVYAPEMVRVVDALKHGLTGNLSFMAIQSLEHILSASAPPFPYEKKFSEIVHEPAIIVHSSGSTGDPKLIGMTHGTFSVTDNDRNIPTPPGRRPQNGAQFHFKDGGRFYSSFPPYHLAGLQSFLILPVFYGATIIVGSPGLPPSGQLVGNLVRKWKNSIKAFYVPPSIIEQWAQEPDIESLASSLDFILYGGGPLSPAVGNFLSQHTSVCQMYGSTEMGQLQLLIPLSNEWEYLEFNPYEEVDMQESHDGGCELVLHQDERFAKSRCLSHTLPHVKEWRTGDLFKRHPGKPNLWKFYTRLDDLILLSTGHKINSNAIELNLASHPLISGAIVVGTGRPSLAILIELESVDGLHDEDIMHSIWTAIEEGNQLVPEFARITRSRIGLSIPSKPFYRNPKGTIVRSLTINSYEKEIDELFNQYMVADHPVLHSTSPEAIMDFVRRTVQSVLPPAFPGIGDTVDLFSLGLDSLKVGEVVQTMTHGLKRYSDTTITTKIVYQFPTLVQLSERIIETLSPGVSRCFDPKVENDHTQLPTLVRKYAPRAHKFEGPTSTDLPVMASVQRAAIDNEKLHIILTGSTGLVGRAMLNLLAKTSRVERIYCLTRSGSLGTSDGSCNNPSIVKLEADFRKE